MPMRCHVCGAQIPEDARFCPSCGAQQLAPAGPDGRPGAPLTKAQFLRHPRLKSCRSGMLAAAVILCVSGALTFYASVLLLGNGIGILDTAILIGTGLGIGLAQSRACAVAACVYTVPNMVITVLGIGMPGGWLPLLGAVFGVITTFRFQDAWQLYCRTGAFPVDRRGRH